MAEAEKIMNISTGDIEKIMGVETGDIETFMGLSMPSLADWKGSRSIIMGGWFYNAAGGGASAVSVQQKTLTTDGDSADFGDLAAAKDRAVGSGSNGVRVVMGGGRTSGVYPQYLQTIDYVTAASSGTFGSAGDLQTGSQDGSNTGASNGTLCFFVGGAISGNHLDRMEQMTISSTSGASTAGDLQFGISGKHTVSNGDSKFLILGLGTDEQGKTAIDTHNFDTEGNSSAYGNVATLALGRTACVSATNRVVTAGGYVSFSPLTYGERMQFFPVASAADGDTSADADLVVPALEHGATSDGTRGEFYGGFASDANGAIQNDIQKMTIASLSDATDIGDLTTVDSASGSHYAGSDDSGIASPSVESAIL